MKQNVIGEYYFKAKIPMNVRRLLIFLGSVLQASSSTPSDDILFLNWTAFIYCVDISLVQVHEKDDIISKDAQSVHSWHFDDEGKKVVDKGVDKFIHQVSPWEPTYALQVVVDVQLWYHHSKTKGIYTSGKAGNEPRVPRNMHFSD